MGWSGSTSVLQHTSAMVRLLPHRTNTAPFGAELQPVLLRAHMSTLSTNEFYSLYLKTE
jgi:hypothetical protein